MLRVLTALVGPFLVLAATACGTQPGPAGKQSGWERLPDGPLTGRSGAVVVALDDDRALVVGGWPWLCPPDADCGWSGTPLLADGAVVDLRTGEWRPVADAPYGLRHAVGATVAGDVYLWTTCRTGRGCRGPAELLRYDVAADRWDRAAAPPVPDAWVPALVPVGGRLLALSGSDEDGEAADQLYDPGTDSWEELPDDPLPEVFDRFAVADGQRVLVLGSVEGGGAKVAAAYDVRGGGWTRLPAAPSSGYQAWGIGDEVWLNGHFGAERGAVLDLVTGTWRPMPDGHPGRTADLAGVVGADEAAYAEDHGWVRDVVVGRWVEVPDRAPGTYDETVATVGTALVVVGGQEWEQSGGTPVDDAWVWRPPAASGRR